MKNNTENTEAVETTGTPAKRTYGMEENLKKALTELLLLQLFSEEEHYIGELSDMLEERSHGALRIVFPYAAIYRMTEAGHLMEIKRRIAPDGRRRQYYAITDQGQAHLEKLLDTYLRCIRGVNDILASAPKESVLPLGSDE